MADTKSLVVAGAAADQSESTAVKKQIEAAITAYTKQNREFMTKLRAVKDRKKMIEMYRNDRPSASEAADLVLRLARKDPVVDGVEQGLTWVVRAATPAQRQEAAQMILTHYKSGTALSTVAQYYGRMRRGGEAQLREIIDKAGDEKIKQGATFYLADKLMRNSNTKQEGIAMMKKLVATPELGKTNPQMLAQANGKIMVAEKLGIGCTAPDIVGTDHEDKEFKLSDYRGKVVLLDFWGIW